MIGKIKIGAGFRGALNYNFRESKGNVIASTMAGKTARELAAEFGAIRALRPSMTRAVFHTSISIAPGEQLSDNQWRFVSDKVLNGLDFEGSQSVVFRHDDTEHPHIHILANRIRIDGSVVSDSKDYARLEKIMRDLEKELGLRIVVDSADAPRRAPTPGELARFARTGEPSIKMRLQQLCDEAADGCTSVSAYEARLALAGVDIIPAMQLAGAKFNGATYRLEGVLMKASDLGKSYTPAGLAKRGVTYDQDRDYETIKRCLEREEARHLSADDRPANDAESGRIIRAADRSDAGDVKAGDLDRSAPGETGSAAPDGQAKSSISAGQRTEHRRAAVAIEQAAWLSRQAGRPAVERDLSAKTIAWRAQREALGAASYSVIMREKSGKTRTLDEAYSGEQIEKMLPSLRKYEQRGRDILIKPHDEKRRFITLHGIDAARLDALKLAGYAPSLVMSAAQEKVDITLQIARADDAATEEAAAAISEQFDADRYDIDAPLPAAGFKIRDAENQRVVARLIEAARIACRKTLDMITAALRRRDDTSAKARAAAEQEKRRTIILDPKQHPLAGQGRLYMQLAREFLMKSPRSSMNDIDVKVAKEMLKEGYKRNEVERPIAAHSPGATAYGVDAKEYARAIVDKALAGGGGGQDGTLEAQKNIKSRPE